MSPVIGGAADWDEAVLATEIAAGQVRQGDQLEVHFRLAGELDTLMEWVEVDEVSDALLRVGGVAIERGTEPAAAAVAVAAHFAEQSGAEAVVSGGLWVRP